MVSMIPGDPGANIEVKSTQILIIVNTSAENHTGTNKTRASVRTNAEGLGGNLSNVFKKSHHLPPHLMDERTDSKERTKRKQPDQN